MYDDLNALLTLTPPIGVRIPVPQPSNIRKLHHTAKIVFFFSRR